MYEKASPNPAPAPLSRPDAGTNGGFWKKNSIAIPGRTNPSKVIASSTFQDFEQSVSDAWEINEDEASSAKTPVGQVSSHQLTQMTQHPHQVSTPAL
jgi:hypothetical protein